MESAFDMSKFMTPDYYEPEVKNKGAVLIQIFKGELPDEKLSNEHNRPMTRPAVMLKKMTSRNHVVERELSEFDLKEEAVRRAYKAFQAREANASDLGIEGTPLEELTGISANQRTIFKGYSIYTIEQLAGVNDLQLQQLGMKSREARLRAQTYLDQAKDGAVTQKFAKMNEELQGLVKSQQESIEELKREVERLKSDGEKKKR